MGGAVARLIWEKGVRTTSIIFWRCFPKPLHNYLPNELQITAEFEIEISGLWKKLQPEIVCFFSSINTRYALKSTNNPGLPYQSFGVLLVVARDFVLMTVMILRNAPHANFCPIGFCCITIEAQCH